MSISTLITKTCTLHKAKPGTDDGYGNTAVAYDDVTTVCELQQSRRDEPAAAGELSVTDWRAYFLPGEAMGANATANKLTVDGAVYQFVGLPWTVRNPRTQSASHIEASLRVAQ